MASAPPDDAFRTAQKAIQALGCGYDVTLDLWLKSCKSPGSLIELDESGALQDLVLPGNVLLSAVPSSIKCDKGDRTRFTSDVLSFNQVLLLLLLLLVVWCRFDIEAPVHVMLWIGLLIPGFFRSLQMSEHFNQNVSVTGKIPLGYFNSAFRFSGSWQKDASSVKALAFDGVFISLYSLQLPRTQLRLKEEVKASLPSSWDPAALAK
jgi:hypothetical protein